MAGPNADGPFQCVEGVEYFLQTNEHGEKVVITRASLMEHSIKYETLKVVLPDESYLFSYTNFHTLSDVADWIRENITNKVIVFYTPKRPFIPLNTPTYQAGIVVFVRFL